MFIPTPILSLYNPKITLRQNHTNTRKPRHYALSLKQRLIHSVRTHRPPDYITVSFTAFPTAAKDLKTNYMCCMLYVTTTSWLQRT